MLSIRKKNVEFNKEEILLLLVYYHENLSEHAHTHILVVIRGVYNINTILITIYIRLINIMDIMHYNQKYGINRVILCNLENEYKKF